MHFGVVRKQKSTNHKECNTNANIAVNMEGVLQMSEDFKVIETQEQLNEIIKGRLEREAKKHSEATAELQSKYDESLQELNALKSANEEQEKTIKAMTEKYAGVDETISSLENKVKAYESDSVKTRICSEVGLPLELKSRLNGNTEEEIMQDAQELLKVIPKNTAPVKNTEVTPTDRNEERDALRDMLKNL